MKYGRLFTEAEKEAIAQRRLAGESAKSLAKEFGCGEEKICKIVPGLNNSFNPNYQPYSELRHAADNAIAQREWYRRYKPTFDLQDNTPEIQRDVLMASKEFNRRWDM